MYTEESLNDQLDPRQCAKEMLTYYVIDEWSLHELMAGQMAVNYPDYAAQIGAVGGYLTDHEGQRHRVDRTQVIVTRVRETHCFVRLDLAELVAEIQADMHAGPKTLAEVFAEQDAAAAAREIRTRRRPAAMRYYFAGHCQNPACGKELGRFGWVEVDGGRNRLYCDDACRVAAFRARKREKDREKRLRYHTELRDYWKEQEIRGEVLLRLQEILLKHGKEAARAATDAVLVALVAQREEGSQQQVRLIEKVMLGGEALGFEEVDLEDFRIAAGWDSWCEFTSHASTTYLKIVLRYVQERLARRQLAEQGRRRLRELGNEPPQDETH